MSSRESSDPNVQNHNPEDYRPICARYKNLYPYLTSDHVFNQHRISNNAWYLKIKPFIGNTEDSEFSLRELQQKDSLDFNVNTLKTFKNKNLKVLFDKINDSDPINSELLKKNVLNFETNLTLELKQLKRRVEETFINSNSG